MNAKADYITLKVTAAINGWIVTENNQPDQVFVRWEAVVSYLKSKLTTTS